MSEFWIDYTREAEQEAAVALRIGMLPDILGAPDHSYRYGRRAAKAAFMALKHQGIDRDETPEEEEEDD